MKSRPRGKNHAPVRRVVFSGGPAAGKTAILDVLRRHLKEQVHVLPEAATTLFVGGFPRPKSNDGLRIVQRAVFTVQRSLEELCELTYPGVPHICDRGSLDGAAYWPGGVRKFVAAMGTTLEKELARYEAVIFLRTCAYAEASYPVDNPHRIETPEQACRLDQRLAGIWGQHPSFHLISNEKNFYEKVAAVLFELQMVLGPTVQASAAPALRRPRRTKR